MFFPTTSTISQGERNIDLKSLSHNPKLELEIESTLETKPEHPKLESLSAFESEHHEEMGTELNLQEVENHGSELVEIDLKPCVQDNRAELEEPQQLSPSLDASSQIEYQVNIEASLRILRNQTTRGVPKVSYEPILNSTPKYPINNYVSYHRLSKTYESFANQLSIVHILNSVQEAIKNSKWKDAMNQEMKSLQTNGTWEVVDLPYGKKTYWMSVDLHNQVQSRWRH